MDGEEKEEVAAAAALEALTVHLCQLCPTLIGPSLSSEGLRHSLGVQEAADTLRKFISDVDVGLLLVEGVGSGGGTATAASSIAVEAGSVRLYLEARTCEGSAVAFIKRFPGSSLSSEQPVCNQLQAITFPGRGEERGSGAGPGSSSVYGILQLYVQRAFAPVVAAAAAAASTDLSSTSTSLERDSASSVALQRRLKELDLALGQCQKRQEIPSVRLVPPKVVAEALQKSRGSAPSDLDALGLLDVSDVVLNEVQAVVNTWVKDIQRLTRLTSSPFPDSAHEEVSFWRGMGEALRATEEELRSPHVEATVALLKQAKRYLATVALDTNTGLSDALDVTGDVNAFLKAFPVDALLSAGSMQDIEASVPPIFNHFGKLKNSKHYDLERAAQLLESVTADLATQLVSLLTLRPLMALDDSNFTEVMEGAEKVLAAWDLGYSRFKEFFEARCKKRLRGGIRSGAEIGADILKGLTMHHAPLTARLKEVKTFHEAHVRFRGVIETALLGGEWEGGDAALKEVAAAYEPTLLIDVLDLSVPGTRAWASARESYEQRIDKVEELVSRLLAEKLRRAKTAEEMFRIFSRFNPLFVRPRIRASIAQFQFELIAHVREAVSALQAKFTQRYEDSGARCMADLRDIPPMAGKVLWARQIERQLETLTHRLEDVLGSGWTLHPDGRQLRGVCDELRRNLDTSRIYLQWLEGWKVELTRRAAQGGFDLYLLVVKPDRLGTPHIAVNFDVATISLFKEVRHLEWLDFRAPESSQKIMAKMRELGDQSAERYPFAMALSAALRTYAQTVARLHNLGLLALLAPLIGETRALMQQAFFRVVKWDSQSHVLQNWTSELSESVFTMQVRAEELADLMDRVASQLDAVSTCAFEEVGGKVASLQESVDELSLSGCSNLSAWVRDLDAKLETALASRLQRAVKRWIRTFSAADSDVGDSKEQTGEDASGLEMDVTTHEILLHNQVLYLSPPLEHARASWIRQFHAFIGTVAALPRLHLQRYAVFGGTQPHRATYASILSQISDEDLLAVYTGMEGQLSLIKSYVDGWLQYQSLWDMSIQEVTKRLGDDAETWTALLLQVKASRAVIEGGGRDNVFGPVVIGYGQVQAKVNLKYDAWQHDLHERFGSTLGDQIRAITAEYVDAKTKLEGVQLDGAPRDVISSVIYVQEMCEKEPKLGARLASLEAGEKVLRRQRYAFQANFPQISLALSAASDFRTILGRRSSVMEDRIPTLQTQVSAESKAAAGRISTLLAEWSEQRPLSGDTPHAEALDTLARFAASVQRSRAELSRLVSALAALGLESSTETSEVTLAATEREVSELKEVWSALAGAHERMAELGETPWGGVTPRKLRRELEALVQDLRGLANRVRQYDAYTYAQDLLKRRLEVVPRLVELRSESLKERHWRVILARLSVATPLVQLSLGHMWDKHLGDLGDIMSQAQGEMALEEFLREVRDFWAGSELDLIGYQGRVRLVRGWSVVFAKLEEHLGSIGSMKSSPYFTSVPEFQEEGALWEDRLTRLQSIFDAWVDVQRRWVYLEGVFFGSADIKAQLPQEFSRFKAVDGEFVALMRRVAAKPTVLDLLSGPHDGLLRQLERQGSLMSKIQKALGDYLEKQRAAFSRFYFVGDEDLLEIIGNANEPAKMMQHLSKMFAGIAGVEISELTLSTMMSKDGEVVPFKHPIKLDSKGVRDWLAELEAEMKSTLSALLQMSMRGAEPVESDPAGDLFEGFPAQVAVLACQITWCNAVESCLSSPGNLAPVLESVQRGLRLCATTVAKANASVQLRRKCEQLITERVHQRDVTHELIEAGMASPADFAWLSRLRFYLQGHDDPENCLSVCMADAKFAYGFEYLGIGERLVQTPLTDRCYLTLTQALQFRMGGNPFGPAGTGKTESVKALGAQLGRFVLVFNCDETFDYGAMGRLFAGLCQVGAWGCFDEFNRLEERILSAVSQQILTIQRGLQLGSATVDLGFNASVRLHSNLGIFVTMNPGYAGRSNLPDNLKQLFRAVAMVIPDRRLIARVMLFSQGLETAQELAGKIVLLFQLCEEQLSPQNHYDFGLRALKSVLVGAGRLRRVEPSSSERDLLIRSACDTVVPKLVVEDRPLFASLISGVFPGCSVRSFEDAKLSAALIQVCTENKLECSSGGEWTEKVLQLKQVLDQRHGVMLVGPSGSGKSSAWKTLLSALELADGIKGDAHIIDPKSISKETLYGKLDPTTLEWTDGVFTKLLREVLADRRGGGADRRHWLVFDGDVDPEWAENLNSVLDDNKILTLPSGERLEVPPSVRILLEVDSLRYTTLATISRCGMVWFSEGAVTVSMMLSHALAAVDPPQELLEEWAPQFTAGSLVQVALEAALAEKHVMEASRERLVATLCSLLERGVALLAEYNESRLDSSLPAQHASSFARKWLLYSLLWGFGGSMPHAGRLQLSSVLVAAAAAAGDEDLSSLLDVHVHCSDGRWTPWSASVPRVEIESHRVISSDVVITTTDTVRHTEVLRAWLGSRRPLILCGPPGSGKTMTLTACLQAMPELVMASLNFSSSTSPSLLLKTFAQYCETVRTPQGLVLQPSAAFGQHKWLVVFCDEINLPSADLYGTQCAITFLRQLVEQGGFWRPEDCQWISLRRVQFVGACNPPTDAGRVPLSRRFLRHAPLLLVDFPATESLHQIYSTFNSALLKLHPSLRGQVDALTSAMIDFYELNQGRFTADQHPQYIYSPRELSRWVRALYEAISPLDAVSIEELGRLWAHEGLRLFSDRLVSQDEREWCENSLDTTFRKHFPMCGESCIERPILFSTWLSKYYTSVSKTELREFIGARLKVFYEEELDVPLVVFDEVLEHVIRIDRVLKQPMGHLLLVGESGVGKTVLSKFVSWMNGLSIFQIKATRSYSLDEFDDDLRTIMKRVGCGGERVCFIFDESNVLGAAFLERMNALLASGEVPGLFEGDDYTALMAACREAAARDGVITDSEEELFRRFTTEVQRNLHVVFTMNPASADFSNRSMTSPALYNRCVVDWFGTWSQRALAQVAAEFTAHVDTADTAYSPPSELLSDPLLQGVVDCEHQGLAGAVVSALVQIHSSVKDAAARRAKRSQTRHFLSPRDFLDLIHAFVRIVTEKRSQLEEQQLHINLGLKKLAETQDSVATLQRGLESKEIHLKEKNELANAKLQQMVSDQNEAERGKAEAEALSKELEVQKAEIAQRTEAAQRELSEAEPALQAAQASVRSIKKSQLDELRALARPPKAVQTVLEAVSKMLGNDATEWSDLRKVIAKQDFISSVVNFETDTITEGIIDAVSDIFERAGDLDAESVQRASKACGPLFQWVHSQTNFSRIVQRVAPLRQEVASLQAKSDAVAGQKATMEEQIATLESSIATYKAEYAEAIREIEAIKAEMGTVKQRVSRAEALLRNLIDEKDRWEASSRGFSEQMGTVIGDCLLGGAFMTYCGMFDYRTRLILLSQWKALLQDLCVPMRTDLSLIDYLSRAADRLSWVSKGLPGDDLAMENAIILERFNRFPLVVDPSGQATSFILSRYAERKIVKTSFLDAGFMKTLASAIRFGTPLLVEDVESIDPILNPVLNKELQRTGGRTLIRLGAEDIDFSPQFLIILATRNPASQFTPDLCSRVTMVNFTVTPASLHGQALGTILRAERPDVDARRNSVLQLQGEQSVKLRGLEERLLDTISAAQGDILEDDTIISALEELKVEAGDVAEEVNRTREVMSEVEATSSLYEPLARACSRVYFAMSSLSEAHFLYQFSLQFFLNILASILGGEKDKDSKDSTESRITTLRGRLFAEAARRVGRSLLNDDKLAFALRLSQIFLEADCGGRAVDGPTPKELELLLHEAAGLSLTGKLSPTGMELGEKQQRELAALCSLPSCAALAQHLQDHPDEWSDFVSSRDSEALGKLPEGWMSADDAASPPRNSLLRLMVVKALRPDRTIAAAEMHLSAVFGEAFPWGEPLDLAEALSTTTSRSPILLACDPGHDAGYKIEALSSSRKILLASVAMGSSEGFILADKSIAAASKAGTWVLLRNTHLCPQWLDVLEKRLHALQAHPMFRLFLTADIHPKLPASLLHVAEILTVEAPTGVRANVVRFLRGAEAAQEAENSKGQSLPPEAARVHALLAWLHAVVIERLRYAPLGWSKRYEFSEADAACALQTANGWLKCTSMQFARGGHIGPEDIPWQAIRTLLQQSIYGGRVDNDFDQNIISSFVENLFVPQSFDVDFSLTQGVALPDESTAPAFLRWAEGLPHSNSPSWLGLAPNAETSLLFHRGQRLSTTLLLIQEDALMDADDAAVGGADRSGKAGRLAELASVIQAWLNQLPEMVQADQYHAGGADVDAKSSADAVRRSLSREIANGSTILAAVRSDLSLVLSFCKGTVKATNEIRELVGSLTKGLTPLRWQIKDMYGAEARSNVGVFVEDLVKRSKHLTALSSATSGGPVNSCNYWLGGMSNPEAFITATRQHVAQAMQCSLDNLSLYFSVPESGSQDASSHEFNVLGVAIEGGGFDGRRLSLSDSHQTVLPLCRLSWEQVPPEKGGVEMLLPLYLSTSRTRLVVKAKISGSSEVPLEKWYQRGTALIAWNPPI